MRAIGAFAQASGHVFEFVRHRALGVEFARQQQRAEWPCELEWHGQTSRVGSQKADIKFCVVRHKDTVIDELIHLFKRNSGWQAATQLTTCNAMDMKCPNVAKSPCQAT